LSSFEPEHGRDPQAWLAHVLAKLPDHPAKRIDEVHLMKRSSLPVDRQARRAKTDVIDVEMLLRTLMAWLRGEPRVCSMIPISNEAGEEARSPRRRTRNDHFSRVFARDRPDDGQFFYKCRPIAPPRAAQDGRTALSLWQRSAA
jgi:hypothetical protein